VRFIADSLHEPRCRGVRLRNPRVADPLHEQPLLSGPAIRTFCHADECDVAEAQRREHLMHLRNLAEPTIDQQ